MAEIVSYIIAAESNLLLLNFCLLQKTYLQKEVFFIIIKEINEAETAGWENAMKEQTYKVFPVMKKLAENLWERDRRQYARIAVYTAAAAVYPFLAVFLPKTAIGILEQGGADAARNLVLAMAVYFAAAAVTGYVVKTLEYVIESANMRMRLRYLADVGSKLMRMDYKYVEDASFWEKNERGLQAFSNNQSGMEGMYNRAFKMPANILTIIGMLFLASGLSPVIVLALIVHVLVILWGSEQNNRYRYDRKEQLAKQKRRINYYYKTTHDFSYGKDIRIYNFRDRILKNYETEINTLIKLIKKFEKHEYMLSLCGIGTLFVTNVLMYGVLIYQAVNGMPVSSFTMYISLITTLLSALLKLGDDIMFLQNEGQYVGDALRLIEENLSDDDKEKIAVWDTPEIIFEHVDFKYPGSDVYVYKDLNFTIHKGESLAIVGVNGAGKSTLVKLMTGLFEPTAGHIYINGTDITKFRKEDLYGLYSAVFQDVNVLAFSIRENVTGTDENVNDAKVKEALDKVGLLKKVESFSDGLDQMMLKVIDENGTDFSGGERQKLSIARGLYKDAPMVIMDEPTAALDALAEAEIYESFSSMVKGKTAVYISHRLASTKFCDKIALFDKGGLKEYGTHDELMEKQGEYYHMFMVQGKYYKEEGMGA